MAGDYPHERNEDPGLEEMAAEDARRRALRVRANGVVCRGCYALGTQCANCARCDVDPMNPKNVKATLKTIHVLNYWTDPIDWETQATCSCGWKQTFGRNVIRTEVVRLSELHSVTPDTTLGPAHASFTVKSGETFTVTIPKGDAVAAFVKLADFLKDSATADASSVKRSPDFVRINATHPDYPDLSLALWIDPGDAPADVIARLLVAISQLHVSLGGKPLEFRIVDSTRVG